MQMKDLIKKGTIESEEVTPAQQELIDIYAILAKVSLVVSNMKTRVLVEKRGGLSAFLYHVQQKKKALKEQGEERDLTSEEYKELELEARYEPVDANLGNATATYQTLLSGLVSNTKYQKVREKVIEEAIDLARQKTTNIGAMKRLDNPSDLL